jgi:hypothetical protein
MGPRSRISARRGSGRIVSERLGIAPDEIAAGHCVALSRPQELADILVGYLPEQASPSA